jgi:molybdenum cofactor biosynthesis protein MoaC
MVDISGKIPTRRSASAIAFILFSNSEPYYYLTHQGHRKGDAVAVARIAGIQAAKKTADLIPLAHPGLGLTGVEVEITVLDRHAHDQIDDSGADASEGGFEFGGVKVIARVSCEGKTGVEMEALMSANMAALTIYDMYKAVDKGMMITGVRVLSKKGGKSDSIVPAPIFASVLRRRAAGIVHDPEAWRRSQQSGIDGNSHPPTSPPNPPPSSSQAKMDDNYDLLVTPEMTPAFFDAAKSELDLFVANTTSTSAAAKVASLRESHKAISKRIKTIQRGLRRGDSPGGRVGFRELSGVSPSTRTDYDALYGLLKERAEVARKVLGWRIAGTKDRALDDDGDDGDAEMAQRSGSGSGSDSGSYREEALDAQGQAGTVKPGQWRWEAGVFGFWPEKQ